MRPIVLYYLANRLSGGPLHSTLRQPDAQPLQTVSCSTPPVATESASYTRVRQRRLRVRIAKERWGVLLVFNACYGMNMGDDENALMGGNAGGDSEFGDLVLSYIVQGS